MPVFGKCETVTYNKRHGFVKYGDFKLMHGYIGGIYATKNHADVYGNVIHGHTHTQESATSKRHDGSEGHSAGCLCKLELGYNSTHVATLRQRNGFLYGFRDSSSNRLTIFRATPVGETWIFPTEFNQ